jgi:glycosyltransferase involved in cell wall biosynthesis
MTNSHFDPGAPCLVLAPHLAYPTRTGADISLDRIARFLSDDVPYVNLIAQKQAVRFQDEAAVESRPFDNAHRSWWRAGGRALLRGSHYLLEKFLTPQYEKVAHHHLSDPAYGTVLCSYILTTQLLDDLPDERLHLVWTHNDQFKWFRDRAEQASNPLARWVAQSSERWLHDFFAQHERDFLFLHVTEADRHGFARHYPDHESIIVPIGTDVEDTPKAEPLSPETDSTRLLFVGGLSVDMNHDALAHFAERYEPVLREHEAELEIVVVGSNPSSTVRELCRERGWALHPNVSDGELHRQYRAATFAILPFAYSTGAKLKLLETLAHGVPFLGTSKVEAQLDKAPPLCLLSDDPAAWQERVDEVKQQGIPEEQRKALVEVAHEHSWKSSAHVLSEKLQERATKNPA